MVVVVVVIETLFRCGCRLLVVGKENNSSDGDDLRQRSVGEFMVKDDDVDDDALLR